MKFLSQSEMSDFKNKRVIVRVDFNVPIYDGVVSTDDAYRISAVAPTVQWLQGAGAKIILISHIGKSDDTLEPVAKYITKEFPEWNISFCNKVTGNEVMQKINDTPFGSCVLLENLRSDEREEKNEISFSQELATYADMYINDAFGVCHRNHASVVSLPKLLPSSAGFLIEAELHQLRHAFNPKHPSLLIMAGIKFDTKLPLIEKLLPNYDHVVLGGGLLNTYLVQSGYTIGNSVFDTSATLESLLGNKKILVPEQVIVERENVSQTIVTTDIQEQDIIVDIVITSKIQEVIEKAETIIWNGPLGWYEKGYKQSAHDIVDLFYENQTIIAGGGDIVSLLRQEKLDHAITFLSTGGGAMLEYLEQGTLPGLEVLI